MTKVTHHFPDELLLDYANGSLGESWALAIATHAEMSSEAQRVIIAYEALGGEMLSRARAQTPNDKTRAACLAAAAAENTIAPLKKHADASAEQREQDPIFPKTLRRFLGVDLDGVKWRSIGGGIKQKIIETRDASVARLLYIPAGVATPWHSHRGNEATVVLAGGFYDGDMSFTRGDVEFTDSTEPHQPRAMEDGPCITLAVTDAPLRFTNILPRLVQPFARI